MESEGPWRPSRRHRRTPYFKLQFWDATVNSWRDEKTGFDTLEEAREFAVAKLRGQRVRVMQVGEKGRWVQEYLDGGG